MPATFPALASGVTFVVPVRNGARWLDMVIAAILAQDWRGPVEIVAIDDGSRDDSRAILATYARRGTLRLVEGTGAGAAAAINAGIRASSHPFVAQIDQDVVPGPGWLAELMRAFDDHAVAAAQGRYVAAPDADLWARVMTLDLEHRYRRLSGHTDHVCTGNAVYRQSAVTAVGAFDERLGYGYDNDLSYRLTAAGYRLSFRWDATAIHHWREGLGDYMRQQYGFGYGRLDLVRKHRARIGGDRVSRLGMMLHAPATVAALALALGALAAFAFGGSPAPPAAAAGALAAAMAVERFTAGLSAARSSANRAGFWFVPVHAARNVAWAAAAIVWLAKRARRADPQASDSMRPRSTPCASSF